MWEMKEIRELKEGRYVNVDEEPCKIVKITTSKPGKHGSAKANIEALSIFTGAKKSIVGPVSTKVQVPMIDKRKGQVLSSNLSEIMKNCTDWRNDDTTASIQKPVIMRTT